ncbi:unnamed protein product, partial [Phaeothamnion confervicola]
VHLSLEKRRHFSCLPFFVLSPSVPPQVHCSTKTHSRANEFTAWGRSTSLPSAETPIRATQRDLRKGNLPRRQRPLRGRRERSRPKLPDHG